MARSDDIVNMIEAIKLGSLGVDPVGGRMGTHISHSQRTSASPSDSGSDPDLDDLSLHSTNAPQKMSDRVKRVQWIEGEPGRMGWVYGVQWSESNRHKFYMNCRMVTDGNYKLYMAGGRDLTVTFSNSFNGRATSADFRGEWDFSASDDTKAKDIFLRVIADIRICGSFAYALASGAIGHGWVVKVLNSQRLEIYLWNSCRVRNTSNMKLVKSVV